LKVTPVGTLLTVMVPSVVSASVSLFTSVMVTFAELPSLTETAPVPTPSVGASGFGTTFTVTLWMADLAIVGLF
jgi:hypothetical protein